MINAGAITAASLVAGNSADDRFERLRAYCSRSVGRDRQVDQHMYASEDRTGPDRTGNRNRAIGYMLRSFAILDEDPQTTWWRHPRDGGGARRKSRCCCGAAGEPGYTSCTVTYRSSVRNR